MQHLVFLQADVLAKVLAHRKRVESRLWRGLLRHPCTVAQVGEGAALLERGRVDRKSINYSQ